MTSSSVPGGCESGERSAFRLGRRTFLAGVGAVSVAGLAGCSEAIDEALSNAFGDVTIISHADGEVHGSIEVTAPDDETVLSETFELFTPTDDDGGGESPDEPSATPASRLTPFHDVWKDSGTYDVTVDITTGSDAVGATSGTESVEIAEPENDILFVVLGDEHREDGIHFEIQ